MWSCSNKSTDKEREDLIFSIAYVAGSVCFTTLQTLLALLSSIGQVVAFLHHCAIIQHSGEKKNEILSKFHLLLGHNLVEKSFNSLSCVFPCYSNWLCVSKYKPLRIMILSRIQRYLVFIPKEVYNIEEICWISVFTWQLQLIQSLLLKNIHTSYHLCLFRIFIPILQKNLPPSISAYVTDPTYWCQQMSFVDGIFLLSSAISLCFKTVNCCYSSDLCFRQTYVNSVCWNWRVRVYIGKWCGFEVGFALIFLCKSMW